MNEIERNELVRLYWHEQFTQYEMARFLNTSQFTIYRLMREKDVPALQWSVPDNPHKDERVLRELYEEKFYNAYDIAEFFDVSQKTIQSWLRNFGIDTRRNQVSQTLSDYRHVDEPWTDADLLERMYHTHLLSAPEIAKTLGCSTAKVEYRMRKHDIETRTQSEAAYVNKYGELPPEDGSVSMDDQQDSGKPVLMADGGEEKETYDPADSIQQAIEQGPDEQSTDDDSGNSSEGDRTPGTLTKKDKLSVRLTLTAWSNHPKDDLSATELRTHALRPLSGHFERRALDILFAHGVIEDTRTVGVSRMYELTGEDVPFSETLTELVTSLEISIPSEELKDAEADPTVLA